MYLERHFEDRHFRSLDVYIGYLLGYDQQHRLRPACQVVFGDRVNMPLADGIVLGGEIGRLDIEASRYSVWLFAEELPSRWDHQLRMPLLQKHYASRMGAPTDEVSVGFYSYSQTRYVGTSYTPFQIDQAFFEAQRLSLRITALTTEAG